MTKNEKLRFFKKEVDNRMMEYEHVKRQLEQEKEFLEQAEDHLICVEESISITQKVAQEVQQQAHDKIANIVSLCLEAVFDDPYTFKIHFEKKRGKTEARLVFERNGLEVDPMIASGGGVVDVASFALRLACLCLSQPPLRRLMVMDEPFKFVSEKFRCRLVELLERLAKDMGVQFILVTHIKELEIGKVIQL